MAAVVTVEGLCKTYAPKTAKEVRALDNIGFSVPTGEIFGLLGPNGAGKTTTIKSICGLIEPDSGDIKIAGIDARRHRRQALSRVAAVLEGNRNIYWRLTPTENLEFFAALRGRNPRRLKSEIDTLLDIFGLQEKRKQPVRKLSRGMQQKLAIAVTLISAAPVLLLDEPTLGLDVKASYEVRSLLREIVNREEKTVIVTTHDMNVVEDICRQVVIINDGRVVADDSTENLLALFKVRSYDLLVGELEAEQQQQLDRIPHLEMEQKDGGWKLSLQMENPAALWQVLDILRARETAIESIDRKELNFERVFMEILGRAAK